MPTDAALPPAQNRRPELVLAVSPCGLPNARLTRIPVAQGPMTRVSDQAAFAAAVAEDGALPFLALALATGDNTRRLMAETATALGDRPWGVGVLGFAPEHIRTAQLDVIRELRPACAIVAGGRPAQAASLEERGISTFLHVPSPGLLGQFLDAGARIGVLMGTAYLFTAESVVLISAGTANVTAGAEFLRSCAQAVAERPDIFAVIVDPGNAVIEPPVNALRVPHVPQLELLPRVSAVVSHAGQNTVCETLYHGIPLVVAPIRDDQPIVAQQAVDAGVAERVRFGRARAELIGAALDKVLTEPGYRAAAEQVAASFKAAGGAQAAARELIRLAERSA
jgi:NAD(P)H-dependent flavin oxidoreductase YrpB (nitropropane dioxygenase family)